MIEQGIYFALGCIVTALCALMFAPVFWRRALRLTRRRLQLQIPLSMQEIYAERDQLRAEFAVERVRLEQELEGVRAGKAADMAEIGRRAGDLTRSAEALDEVKRVETGLRSELQQLRQDLSDRDARLGTLRSELDDAHHTIEQLREAAAAPPPSPAPEAALEEGSPGGGSRDVRTLEEALASTQAALAESREREKGLHLLRDPKAGEARPTEASETVGRLEAENAALRTALESARRDATGGLAIEESGLRESIHALGIAVAEMTREARGHAKGAEDQSAAK